MYVKGDPPVEIKVCKCRKGYVSAWDGKCGHCRTRREQEAVDKLRYDLVRDNPFKDETAN